RRALTKLWFTILAHPSTFPSESKQIVIPVAVYAMRPRTSSRVIASASSFRPAISAARNASTAASIAGGCGLIGPSGCGPITLARFPRSGIGEAPAFAAVVGDVAPWRALGGDILHARDHPSPLRFLPSKQQRHRGAIGMIKPDLGDEVGADTRAGQRLIARDGAAGAELARRGAPSFHRAREHEGLGGAIVTGDHGRRVRRDSFIQFRNLHQLRPSFLGPSCSDANPVTPPDAPSSSSRCACHWTARRCFSGESSRTSPFSTCDFSSSSIRARIRIVGGS